MTHCITPVLFSLLIGSSLLHAQTTWIVDLANGPGTHFTDLPQAVQAAAPGDIIRVRRSPFWPFQFYQAAVIDKPLSILGDSTFPPIFIGMFEVHSIPLGSCFLCANIRHGTIETRTLLTGAMLRGWNIHDNAGTIQIDRMEYGWDPATFENRSFTGILIDRCNLAIISRSIIWSSDARTTVRDSTFIATDSQFRESTPYVPLYLPPETMHFERSDAWLVDCLVRGTDGAPHFAYERGKEAILLCNTTLRVCGTTRASGGQAAGGGGGGAFAIMTESHVRCWNQAGTLTPTLYIDPRATVVGTPWPAQTIIQHDQPVPALAWSIDQAQTTLTTLHYTTATSLTLLASGPLLPTPLVGPLGTLFLDPAGLFVLDVGLATGQGLRTVNTPIPANVVLPTSWAIQAVELTPTGSLLLSQAVIAGVY